MVKECPAHGLTEGLVERDALFYQSIRSINSPSIYDGHFIDVTRTCNLRCEFCYYKLEKEDPEGEYSLTNILNECRVNRNRAPFIITGGEPTLRPDIVELLAKASEVGQVHLITNGTKICEESLFAEVSAHLIEGDGTVNINLSIHIKETDKWMQVVEHCKKSGLKMESALIVVSSRDEFYRALAIAKTMEGVCRSFRIKAASKIWNEQKPGEKIFVSDMWQWLEDTGLEVKLVTQKFNKVSFVNVWYNGLFLMLVSWYDRTNIDLLDVDCSPSYRARNGEIANMVTAMLINEGVDAGWVKGRRVGR